MKVVIIGANGFIGRNLSKELARNKRIKLSLVSRKFDSFFNQDIFRNCNFFSIDYRHQQLESIVENSDIVYFLVSSSIPSSSWSDPVKEIETNILDTVKFIQIVAQNNVKKIVYLSSGGTVYGNTNKVLNENSITEPFSPYGISKLTIERYLAYFRIKNKLDYTVFRISNVYGPGLEKENFGVINNWLNKVLRGDKIEIYGSLSISKDFVFVNDVAKILSNIVYVPQNFPKVINLCKGEVISLQEILDMITRITKKDIKSELVEVKDSDNKFVALNNDLLMKFMPKFKFTELSEGILLTWKDLSKKNED